MYNTLYASKSTNCVIYNGEFEDSVEQLLDHKELKAIDMDLDTWGLRKNCDRLEIPWTEENILRYHPAAISAKENKWLQENNGLTPSGDRIRQTIRYPEDNIKDEEQSLDLFERSKEASIDSLAPYLASKETRTRKMRGQKVHQAPVDIDKLLQSIDGGIPSKPPSQNDYMDEDEMEFPSPSMPTSPETPTRDSTATKENPPSEIFWQSTATETQHKSKKEPPPKSLRLADLPRMSLHRNSSD